MTLKFHQKIFFQPLIILLIIAMTLAIGFRRNAAQTAKGTDN